MKPTRRVFLKSAATAGSGLLPGPSLVSCHVAQAAKSMELAHVCEEVHKKRAQRFNMCGYGAPPPEKVRIGFIGLGPHRNA